MKVRSKAAARLGAVLTCLAWAATAEAASLLPNGKQHFDSAVGTPCAGCSVYFYQPGTTTPKSTWQDPAQTIPNPNPVVTDGAGNAVIYGQGVYRQVLKDAAGSTIWDQLTADPTYGTTFPTASFGAVCDGVTDDTGAIQAAIAAAQAAGGEVLVQPGSCKITASLNVTSRVRIRGVGYQGDAAGGFQGHGVTQTTGFRASVLVVSSGISAIVATTDDAVSIEDLQITYPTPGAAGTSGILIQALSGPGHGNSQSAIRRVMLTGAYISIRMVNCLDFAIADNKLLYSILGNILLDNPNWPNYQQSQISGNQLWGADNTGFQWQIQLRAGGDLRIVNNKLNAGGYSNGIALFGATTGSGSVEPIVIAGNTLEGQANGITFNSGNGSVAASQIAITGNQIWAGGHAILVNANNATPTVPWVVNMTISGNSLAINGGSNVGGIISFNGVDTAVISGNVFGLAGGGTGRAIDLGPNNAHIRQSGNNCAVGVACDSVSTPAFPASGVAVTNTFASAVEVSVYYGWGTIIMVNNQTALFQDPANFKSNVTLNPGDTISITYSYPPGWTWRAVHP